MVVARGKIVKDPDEPCFDCNRYFPELDYFICMNGEWQGHCLECLEKIQRGESPIMERYIRNEEERKRQARAKSENPKTKNKKDKRNKR